MLENILINMIVILLINQKAEWTEEDKTQIYKHPAYVIIKIKKILEKKTKLTQSMNSKMKRQPQALFLDLLKLKQLL